MHAAWSNWSGSLRFTPSCIETPGDEAALTALVRRAAAEGQTVRVVGAGHSSTPLVETDDLLVSLKNFQDLLAHDTDTMEATLQAGMVLRDAGEALLELGLMMHNFGDINVQTVAGAFGTGTHGTGKKLQDQASQLIGGRIVNAAGEILSFSENEDAEFLRAARVSLGVLGIFTALRLRLQPAFKLRRREWCTPIDTCLANLEALVADHRNFDFYWYPRRDEAKLRTWNSCLAGMHYVEKRCAGR